MKRLLFFLLLSCRIGQVSAQIGQERALACGFKDSEVSPQIRQMMLNLKGATARLANEPLREMKVWVVVDSTIYGLYKADTNAIKAHIYFAYQQVNVIYNKQVGIHLNVVAIEFLKKKNRYNYTTRGVANEFGQYYNFTEDYVKRKEIIRDLTVLWSRYTGEPYGGLAGGTFQHDTGDKMSPHIMAHETGHNLGSPHTHHCSWKGGPIDACNDVEGGDCYAGVKTSNTGTIMSYCNQYGANGYEVFHPLCVELMQQVAKDRYGLIPMQSAPFRRPLLHYPANATENFNPNAYLSWSAIVQTTHYQIQVSEKADFSTVLFDTTTTATLTWFGKSVAPNTTYYWRVCGRNESGAGVWSGVSSFKTPVNITLSKPIIYEVYDLRSDEDQTIAFSPISNASEYEISFHRNLGSDVTLSTANTYTTIKTKKTTLRLGELLDPKTQKGSYRWRVRAINGANIGEWNDEKMAVYMNLFDKIRLTPYSSVPYNLPTGFPLTVSTGFNRLDDYRKIKVEIAKTQDFKTIAISKELVSYDANEPKNFGYGVVPITGLEPDTKYYYRASVISRIDSGTNVAEFTTGPEERWTFTNNGTNNLLPASDYLKGIYIDNTNTQWAYGVSGVYAIKTDGNVVAYNQATTNKLLPNTINDVFKDNTGKVWAATSDGLAYLENNQWTVFRNRVPFGRNVGGYIWYNGFSSIKAAPNNGLYVHAAGSQKILHYDGSNWKDITPPGSLYPNYAELFESDKNGVLSIFANNKLSSYENGTWSEIKIPNVTENPNTYFRVPDNLGRIWFGTWDPAKSSYTITLFTSKTDIKTMPYQISFVEYNTGTVKNGFLISFLTKVLVGSKYTYFLGYNGFLEYDGSRYVYYNYPTNILTTTGGQSFSIDSEDRLYYVDSGNTIYRFDRSNFNGFLQKQVGVGCNNTFRVGIATPPANSMALKFYLSDATGGNFKEIPATYKEGKITFSLSGGIEGKGYRVKYTLGDMLQSKESEAFEVVSPFSKLTVTGNNTYCFGSSTPLKVEVAGGKTPYTYEWSKGGSSDSYAASAEGSYTVKVTDANGCTQTSSAFSVTSVGAKEALITPAGNTSVYEPNTVILNANTGDKFAYQWQKDGTDIAGATVATYEAKESGSYVVKVQKDGCSLASAAVAVKIDKLLSAQTADLPQKLSLSNYPNPFETTTTIKLGLPKKSSVLMRVLNTKGEVLKIMADEELFAGWYLLKFTEKNLPVGTYFCQVKTDVGTKVVKMIVK